jgi:hypothetical protein
LLARLRDKGRPTKKDRREMAELFEFERTSIGILPGFFVGFESGQR